MQETLEAERPERAAGDADAGGITCPPAGKRDASA